MRVGVVGVGGAGSAAVRHLAEAGHEVVGFEQFSLGHNRGSSHGETRIIRYTYPDPVMTVMVREAFDLWRDLEEQIGEELFVRCGSLFLGSADDPQIVATEQAYIASGLPFKKFRAEALQEQYPAFRLERHEVALYQPESGFLRAARCVLANCRLARAEGAVILENTGIRDIQMKANEVILHTEKGAEHIFDRVIVTAGAWSGKLFARLNLPFEPTRQQVVYLKIARNPDIFQPDRCPVWVDNTRNFYGFPDDGSIEGIKFASHDHGETVDPDAPRRSVDDAYIRRAIAYAAIRQPDLSDQVTHVHTCLYTNTPDEDFVIDRVPDMPRVWLVTGCSGHGFKFTIELGKIAADVATDQPQPIDMTRFSVGRFKT